MISASLLVSNTNEYDELQRKRIVTRQILKLVLPGLVIIIIRIGGVKISIKVSLSYRALLLVLLLPLKLSLIY